MFIMKKLLIIHKTGTVKQIGIKNRTYYFYNDIINLENLKSNSLKIDKESYKGNDIYNIECIIIKKIDDFKNICSVYPLYLHINHINYKVDILKKKG